VARSNRTRFSVHCQNLGCTFAINVFKSSKMNAHITKLVLDHTCDRFANLEVRASSSYVARRVQDVISDNPRMPVGQIMAFLKREDRIDVPYWAVWKGRQKALVHYYGDVNHSFSLIASFIQQIQENGMETLLK
jgi:hypothetical protein